MVPFTGDAVNAEPLQIVVVIAVIFALGLTVTVNWNEAPAQLPDKGVTV